MEKRYESCTLTDLAQLAGMDLRTFQKRISPTDLKQMVDLGWNPFERSLLPPVVRYLRDRFVDAPKPITPPMP